MPPGKRRRRREHVDYEVVYEAVRDRPLTVESLVFHGLGRTRPELVVREFRRLHRAETLDDVRHELLEAHDALKALGPYDSVEVVLDDSATARPPTLLCLLWRLLLCQVLKGVCKSFEVVLCESGPGGLAQVCLLQLNCAAHFCPACFVSVCTNPAPIGSSQALHTDSKFPAKP